MPIYRQLGDKSLIISTLGTLGWVAIAQANHGAARAFRLASLELARELDGPLYLTFTIESFAALAAAKGRADRALRLGGAAAAMRDAIGAPWIPFEQAFLERWFAVARQALTPEVAAAAWAEGQAMTPDEAITYALQDSDSKPSSVEPR